VTHSLPNYGVADHVAVIAIAVATLQAGDFAVLREARRKALYNVSDESFSDYLAYTQIMIGMLNRLDLYKEYRSHSRRRRVPELWAIRKAKRRPSFPQRARNGWGTPRPCGL